jgi:hypothetical protein
MKEIFRVGGASGRRLRASPDKILKLVTATAANREHTGDRRVEKLDDDGESSLAAVFSGNIPAGAPSAASIADTKP